MQESPVVLPHWIQTAFGWLASGVAGGLIVRLYTIWLNRKKPAAEVQLTQANATEVTVRAYSAAGDAVGRMLDRLDMAQQTIDRLRQERDAWQDEYDKVFVQRDELLRKNGLLDKEIENYEGQLTTMRATLKSNRLNFDNTQDLKLPKP
jgi:hypothetical protein